MQNLDLPGFTEITLSNRIIDAEEKRKAFFRLENQDIQCFIFEYESGHVAESHSHEELRLTLIRSGKLEFTLGGVPQELGSGDFITILPGELHSFTAIGDGRIKLIEFVVFDNRS